ncbi:MAG: hypothetical protein ACYTFW_09600, partial [Planctomycetota bacterium]
MKDNEKYIEEFVKDVPFDAPEQEHRDELKKQLMNAFPKHRLQPTVHTVEVWRTIMKSPVVKIAAVVIIIVAVLIGIHQFGGSAPAFAEIIEPLLTARTVTCKVTINLEGEAPETRDCMFMEPGRSRQVLPSGVIRIKDKPGGKEMDLYPAEKKVIIYEMTNIPEDKQRSDNWFERIRECIRHAQQNEDESVT